MGSGKKHKKHKKEKYEGEKPPALKLILKVGNSSTPEHSDSPTPLLTTSSYTITPDDESLQSSSSLHKKSKKKKKKKDRDHEKHERKKKHHHKERKRHIYDESSDENLSFVEDSSTDLPVQMKDCVPKRSPEPQTLDPTDEVDNRAGVEVSGEKEKGGTPFQKLLEYLQEQLEKKDVKQVFAWPVTDQIAPGYSQTITQPMDFSTMRQKIEDNSYKNLNAYISDLQLMCNNAMTYNRADTMYYKAAKRLLHAGLKFLSSDKLRALSSSFPLIAQVPPEQLGFMIVLPEDSHLTHTLASHPELLKKEISLDLSPKRRHNAALLENKFEAIPDDLSPEEILRFAQEAARKAAEKLASKRPKTSMGYLQQKPDGATALCFFGPEDETESIPERVVTLNQLTGKPSHGSGQPQGPKDDRRNSSKTVKPLNYGAFGSYAPSYDSTFANLSKEETDLVYETYGDENATLYAESILNFAKDCDYTLTMVDNLLDLLTGGEHRKAKTVIDEHRKFREEEEKVKELMESKNISNYSNFNSTRPDLVNLKIEVDQLRTLSEFGIDTSFLNELNCSKEIRSNPEKVELSNPLPVKLQVASVPSQTLPSPTPHFTQILHTSSDNELHLADKIPDSFPDLTKQEVPPGPILPVPGVRKPLPLVPEGNLVTSATNTVLPINTSVQGVVTLEEDSSGEEEACVVGVGVDFESELREFLESDTALSGFPLHDDKTIEEMLSES